MNTYRFETSGHYTPYMYFAILEFARETHRRIAQEREVGDIEILCPIHGWQPIIFDEGGCIECVCDANEWYEEALSQSKGAI